MSIRYKPAFIPSEGSIPWTAFPSTVNTNSPLSTTSNRYLHESHFGEKMGMKFHTDVMGDVTTNVGIINLILFQTLEI
jgi:hypothetical protein